MNSGVSVHDSLHGTLVDGNLLPSSDVHMFLKDWESNVDGIRIQQSMFALLLSSYFPAYYNFSPPTVAIAIAISDTLISDIKLCSLLCTAVTWLAGDPIISSGETWRGST